MLTWIMPTVQSKIFNATIVESKNLSDGITQISLKLDQPFSFSPGQYIWVELLNLISPDPRGERRAFSITSTPGNDTIQIILRGSESGYKKTFLYLKPGELVKIHGPFGSFLKDGVEGAGDMIFVAGGLAVAPFISVIRSLVNINTTRNFYLIQVDTTPEETPFSEELKGLSSSNKNFKYVSIFGQINPQEIVLANTSFPSANWYVTGPQGFVDSTWKYLRDLNMDPAKINFEEHYPTMGTTLISSENLKDITNNNLFKLAVDRAFIHFMITDINGYILYANKAAEEITGYKYSEMQGNTPRLWGGLMDHTFYKKVWSVIKDAKQPFSGEITNRRKSGEVYTARATISPITDKEGLVVGFLGTEEDITELTKAQEDTRRLASIVAVSKDAIYSKDLTGNILTWNSGAEGMYGYMAQEIVGENIDTIIPDHLRGEEKVIIARVLKGEIIKRYDTQRIRKDGTILDVELSVSPIKDENGTIVAISVIGRDITEQKRIKENTDRMNKLMVGRELRMIELKKLIEQMKGGKS